MEALNMKAKRSLITITILFTLLLSTLVQAQESVFIPDENLKAAVQEVIGDEITTGTMLKLTTFISASGRGVTDLTGLEHAKNLIFLAIHHNSTIDNNSLSNLSPLSGLTKLKTLDLWGNSISDLSPLSGLTQLTTLNLSKNSISDVSELVGLTQLTHLDLRGNPLNAAAISTHIPAIQANGAQVLFDNPKPTPPPAVPDPVQPIGEKAPTPPTGMSLAATSTPIRLTEATLHNSTVTLTLQGGTFANNINTIRGAVSTSGIFVILPADGFRRDSDTQITMRLTFNSDLTNDGTLTFTVPARIIENYNGSALTATVQVAANAESLTATPSSLTEATLDGSLVRLTLRGRKFANNIAQYVTNLGIAGVRITNITRVSDTEVSVRLAFNGNLDSDATLTFWINQGGIPSYPSVLTVDLPVTTSGGRTAQPNVRTTQPADLTISNFRVSKTTVAPGEQFTLFATVKNRGAGQSPVTPLQFQRTLDDFYTQIGTRSVSTLGANRSVEVNFPTTAPVPRRNLPLQSIHRDRESAFHMGHDQCRSTRHGTDGCHTAADCQNYTQHDCRNDT